MTARRRRIVRRISLALAGLILLVGGAGFGAYRYYDSRITRVDLPALGHVTATATPSAAAAVATGSYFLIAGSDTRAVSDGSSFQSTSAGAAVSGQRSDTVMLVHIPAGSARATIVSFPRDSYVTIPTYTSSAGVTTVSHKAKLNEAFALGGANLLVQTVEDLTGLPIDHYLQVDFDGFRSIVDAVGGVTLCVTTTRADADSGDYLTAGLHTGVSGDAALAFVRDRKGLVDGDLSRIQDQQYFLSQVLHKVLSAGTLANPARLSALLSAATASVTVDAGFGLAQLRTLASHLRSLSPARVTFVTLPITTASGTRVIHGLSQSVVLLDDARLPAAWSRLAGTSTTAAASPSPSTSPSASAAPTATPGAAGAVSATTSASLTCAP